MRIRRREDERAPTLGYGNFGGRMVGRRDIFLVAMDYPALRFDKYGLRTIGRPLHDKTKLMPILRHIRIRKQRLITIFVCDKREESVRKIPKNEEKP
jgi:hypothetical protein